MMELLISPGTASLRAVYQLAGEDVTTDVHPDILQPFQTDREVPSSRPPMTVEGRVFDRVLDAGIRSLGDVREEMICALGREAYRLDLGRCGTFIILRDGTRAECIHQAENPDHAFNAALGPVLILGLALQEKFSLHGSAVRDPQEDCADLFVGESGAGKSTLAAFLASQGRERLADDITVVYSGARSFSVRPDFPQLKLTAQEQPTVGQPRVEDVPLRHIYLLRRGERAAAYSLAGSEAVRTVLGQTVASRYFAPELASRHLHFGRHLALRGSVRVLEIPWDLERLGEVSSLLFGLPAKG